ncbi:Rieske (2Fe-2S) protein [Adhaeretor mobilis]|uniref:3-phenylpropionate/cinnamic acid dioxygenase ferredoxin subunit n=1 Tax=Adhaeretor mobilis TaxID=1930276 RepID=A0A517N0W6_9BACT|nr:Rieske (2Fe-2S) protein [Adhaeretor mobilis]QDT00764.1 3-phenylpropionate/cinnamic acid dioxygenase ferredoxin subunit [Adhaeretor mobilis]
MSDDFVTVTKTDALPPGEGGTFHVGERLVAVFNLKGEFFAIDDLCPHMGASLGAGQLDEEGCVMCPWHAWSFNVCDGRWLDNPRLKIDRFEVRVSGDEVQVRVVPIAKDASEDDLLEGEA